METITNFSITGSSFCPGDVTPQRPSVYGRFIDKVAWLYCFEGGSRRQLDADCSGWAHPGSTSTLIEEASDALQTEEVALLSEPMRQKVFAVVRFLAMRLGQERSVIVSISGENEDEEEEAVIVLLSRLKRTEFRIRVSESDCSTLSLYSKGMRIAGAKATLSDPVVAQFVAAFRELITH